MKRFGLACIVIALVGASAANAQERLTEHTIQADEKAAVRERVTIEEFAWLAGHWVGEGLGGPAEEIWSPPRGKVMMSVFRVFQGDKPRFYEFVTLAEEGGTVVMRLKHFNADLTGWEEKDKVLSFPLTKRDAARLQFGGILFERSGEHEMTVTVSIRQRDGTVGDEPFRFKRALPI